MSVLSEKDYIGLSLNAGLVRINHSGFGIGYSYQFHAGNKVMDRHINNSTHEIALSYSFQRLQNLL